jgi:hypothetical protein
MWRAVIAFSTLIGLGLAVSGYFQQRKHPDTFPTLATTVGLGLLLAFSMGYLAGRVVRRHVQPAAVGYSYNGVDARRKPPGWVYLLPFIGGLVPVAMQAVARVSLQAADLLGVLAMAGLTVMVGFAAAQLPWPPDPNDPRS